MEMTFQRGNECTFLICVQIPEALFMSLQKKISTLATKCDCKITLKSVINCQWFRCLNGMKYVQQYAADFQLWLWQWLL